VELYHQRFTSPKYNASKWNKRRRQPHSQDLVVQVCYPMTDIGDNLKCLNDTDGNKNCNNDVQEDCGDGRQLYPYPYSFSEHVPHRSRLAHFAPDVSSNHAMNTELTAY
jgi:hypothetical protein